MDNEQLTQFVREGRARGVSDDELRSQLLEKGWRQDDVSAALGNTTPGTSAVTTSEFSFQSLATGRLDRTNYFFVFILGILLNVLVNLINSTVVELILGLFVCVIGICATIRRWHDLGKSGWWTLTGLIPIANIFIMLYLWIKKGDEAPNMYGPVPNPGRNFVDAILNK